MAKRYTDEFRRDAVRIATTSGLTRPQVSSDLGVGLSTLNKRDKTNTTITMSDRTHRLETKHPCKPVAHLSKLMNKFR